jgi:hypothetical protein
VKTCRKLPPDRAIHCGFLRRERFGFVKRRNSHNAQAAKHLKEKVPMDSNAARQEAIAFSTGPSQAMTYQIGKLQTDLRLFYFQTDCFILAT